MMATGEMLPMILLMLPRRYDGEFTRAMLIHYAPSDAAAVYYALTPITFSAPDARRFLRRYTPAPPMLVIE